MSRTRKSWIACLAAVCLAALLAGAACLGGLFGNKAFAATTADDAVIFEDFEDAAVTEGEGGRKQVTSQIYSSAAAEMEIVTEKDGNKALKFMYAQAAANDDERALIIEKTDAVAWAPYIVSFYVKKAAAGDLSFRVRSGWPSNNYGEHRQINTAGTDEQGRPPMAMNAEGKGMLVTQVIPCDPGGLLRISVYPTTVSPGCGLIIDDILVEPYSAAPEGKVNEIANAGFTGWWDGAVWHFDNWQQPTAGSGFNGNWDPYCLSDGFSGYLGTSDGAPVQLTQSVTLKADTEYNFSIWVRKAYEAMKQVPHEKDVFSVKLVSGEEVVSHVDFRADLIGQDAFEQYIKLGGVLKTGAATDYTFVLEYDVPDAAEVPMSWRVMQIDEAVLYEADVRDELDLSEAQKSENVTLTDDPFSAVEGDKVLQADISSAAAEIVFPVTVTPGTLYTAYVDAQKLPGLDAVLNMVKPMNVRFSVETQADGQGETLAELTDTRQINKAIETLRLTFESGENTQLYLRVTVDALPDTEDAYIRNNCLIAFKNFAVQGVDSVQAGEDRSIQLHGTADVTVTAEYTGGISLDVTDRAEIVSQNTQAVTVEGNTLTGVGVGSSEITVTFEGKTDTFTVTVLDNVLSVDAGEDRSIALGNMGVLTATAGYEVGEDAVVTAQAQVVIADPSVLSYADGTFTALKVGSTLVTVHFGGQSDSFTVTVPEELVNITAPAQLSVPVGGSVSVTVTAHYNDGTSGDVSSSASLQADGGCVTAQGSTLTGVSEGTAEITVTYGQKTAKIAVRVTKAVASISAGEDCELATNATLPLAVTATLVDETSDAVPAASVSVDIEDGSVLSYADGVFTPLQAGETDVTVSYGGKTDTFTVTVYVKTLESIEIEGGDFTLEFGQSAELKVVGHYNDGDELPLSAVFGIREGEAVSINGSTVTAVRGGTAVIEAVSGGKSASVTVTVPKRVQSVAAGDAFTLNIGESRTLAVTVTYNDGTSAQVTDGVSVASQDDKLTVSGLSVTAAKAGEGKLTVTYGGQSATVIVTVANPVTALSVTAGEAKAGKDVALTITATYADGSTQTVTEGYTVASSDACIAVEGTAVRAEAEGTATLTVTYGGQSATVEVTVEGGGCGGSAVAVWPGLCALLLAAAAVLIAAKRKKA